MSFPETLEFKNYYVEKQYMVANVETGVLTNRSGRRMLALTNDFLIGLHRALESECGERAGEVLYRCGKKWGKNFGKGLTAEWSAFYECSFTEFPLAFVQTLLEQEFACNGWGILDIDYQHHLQGVLILILDGAIMSDITTKDVNYPIDVLTAGIVSGMFTELLGKELDCVQSQVGKSANGVSKFLLSDAERIKQLNGELTKLTSNEQMLDYLLKTRSK